MYKIKPYEVFFFKQPKQQTIFEMAQSLIDLMKLLEPIDSIFKCFDVVSEKKIGGVENIYAEDAIIRLAEKILLRNIRDIRKYDKVESPDIFYMRESPNFSCALSFGEGKNQFSWLFSWGGSVEWRVTTLMASKNYLPNLNWYLSIVKIFIHFLAVEEVIIRLGDMNIRKKTEELNFKFPLGVINYFSNDFEITIPDNLPHVIYEQMPNGKLFYFPSEDINASGEPFDKLVNDLFEVMAALKESSPNYAKS